MTSLKSIVFAAMLMIVSPLAAQKKGDVNVDSRRSVADVTCLIRDLLTQTMTSFWSDVDGDGMPTLADIHLAAEMVLGRVQEQSFVDLGLPSGRLWAVDDMPGFYAWGETEAKSRFVWSNYMYSGNGTSTGLTKYCTQESCWYVPEKAPEQWVYDEETETWYLVEDTVTQDALPDGLASLQTCDDAATQRWGSQWALPTEADWRELLGNCVREWVTRDGRQGVLLTGCNGNQVFFATSGFCTGASLVNGSSRAYYWLPEILYTRPSSGYCAILSASGLDVGTSGRNCGLRLRPVVKR